MKQIKQLTEQEEKDLFNIIHEYFEYRDGKLFWIKKKGPKTYIGKEVGSLRKDGYRHTYINGRAYFVHHLIWLYHTGSYPENNIDHINRDITDDSIENLRLADKSQNRGNSAGWSSKELPIGVHLTKSGKYMAVFRNKHLITTPDITEASDQYQRARQEYYGEYAYITGAQ